MLPGVSTMYTTQLLLLKQRIVVDYSNQEINFKKTIGIQLLIRVV